MIRAVVFDLDGVVLDTEYAWLTAWQEVFRRYGAEVDESEMVSWIGTHFDAYRLLVERATVALPSESEVRAAKRVREQELHSALHVLPGVESWIEEAAGRDLALAIASSSGRSWVTEHLRRLGLLHRFGELCCCEDGVPPKPAPDCYIAACEALAVDPVEALAVEDSANGIEAAKAAGLWCVAVPNPLTRKLDLSAADLRVASLADMPLADALRAIRER